MTQSSCEQGSRSKPQTHRGWGLPLLGMGHGSDWTGQITDDNKKAHRGQRAPPLNLWEPPRGRRAYRLQMTTRRPTVTGGPTSQPAGATEGQESLVVHGRRQLGAQAGTGGQRRRQQAFRQGRGRRVHQHLLSVSLCVAVAMQQG